MNPVSLGTLIRRVRQRCGLEGATAAVTDYEITDHLNVSLANELYDLIRQAVGDNYYRKTYQIATASSVQSYDLPADFLSLISADAWLAPPTAPGSTSLKINLRRYMEFERNMYQQILLGWTPGATALYTLSAQQITFQPTPTTSAAAITLNYVPVSPQIGGGPQTPAPNADGTWQPCNYTDTWDDVNGWSELAVLDAAEKVCLKYNRLDMVAAMQQRRAALALKIRGVINLRHAGEPDRMQQPMMRNYGDGWLE